jgi:hypothetical protein
MPAPQRAGRPRYTLCRTPETWPARVTLKYRALAVKFPDEYLWFWIGEHNVYDALTK